MKEKPSWDLQWKARSNAEAAFKITCSILFGIVAYCWHLAGWTITVHYDGRVVFRIPELW